MTPVMAGIVAFERPSVASEQSCAWGSFMPGAESSNDPDLAASWALSTLDRLPGHLCVRRSVCSAGQTPAARPGTENSFSRTHPVGKRRPDQPNCCRPTIGMPCAR